VDQISAAKESLSAAEACDEFCRVKQCFEKHFIFFDKLPLTPAASIHTEDDLRQAAPQFVEFGAVFMRSIQMFNNVPIAVAAPQFSENVAAIQFPLEDGETYARDAQGRRPVNALLNPDYIAAPDAEPVSDLEFLTTHCFHTARVTRPSRVHLWGTALDGSDYYTELSLNTPGARYVLQAIDIVRGVSVETKMPRLLRDQLRRQVSRALRKRKAFFHEGGFSFIPNDD
jgi:hypothetical protein